MQLKQIIIGTLLMSTMTLPSRGAAAPTPAEQARFIGYKDFTSFKTSASSSDPNAEALLSPVIKAPIDWTQLIVSWNAETPPEAFMTIEARCIFPGHETKYYTMGHWSLESATHKRGCVNHQRDLDGTVNEDTLVMNKAGADVQLRITLSGPSPAVRPKLKFIGISFCDTRMKLAPLEPNRAVWGKVITTPELSQHSYPQEEGWCSATSVAMVLGRWGDILNRPELKPDVPEVATNVYDFVFRGTGNWPFNTAYAGSFPGMRAYVTRFSDIAELEDWINAGIPVVISAPWHLLAPGRHDTGSGHLTVCIGFDENGDVYINDPATNLKKGQKVRHLYKRKDVINAWKESNNTVYLVYPETVHPPADRFGHWDKN